MPKVKRERQRFHRSNNANAMDVDATETVEMESAVVEKNKQPQWTTRAMPVKQSKKDKQYEKHVKWMQRT